MRGLLLTSLIVILLAACAPAGAEDGGGRPEPSPDAAAPTPDPAPTAVPTPAPDPAGDAEDTLYEATAMVLESPEHGPELCLGGVASSLPPQCGGPPITNWDWETVEGWETAAGTTWGAFHVVGTYDGASFTVTEVGPPREAPPPDVNLDSPCPEPEGGWPVPDPERASMEHLDQARVLAEGKPDSAGLWISYLEPMGGNVAEDPGEFVVNAAFTDNLAEREAEVREVWGGRLCVTRFERTLAELRRISEELWAGAAEEIGLKILASGLPTSMNTVDIRVEVIDEESLAELDRRYGQGTVRVTAALTPVTEAAEAETIRKAKITEGDIPSGIVTLRLR